MGTITEGALAKAAPGRRVTIAHPKTVFSWPGSAFEAYARGYVSRNFWRVAHILQDREDAMQECAISFLHCVKRYENTVTNNAWMMSLYKRALAMDWADLSRKDTRARSLPIPDETEQVDFNLGALTAALNSGSAELKLVVRTLATAPAEFLSLIFSKEGVPREQREADISLNRRIKRLLGISNPAADVVSELRSILEG